LDIAPSDTLVVALAPGSVHYRETEKIPIAQM